MIEKFGGNFQSKMGCAPHHLASQGASPQGEALTKARITLFAEKIKFTEFFSGKRGSRDFGAVPGFQKTSNAPHQSTLLTASPQGEAKIRQNFNLPSIGAARHFPRKGKARGKRGKQKIRLPQRRCDSLTDFLVFLRRFFINKNRFGAVCNALLRNDDFFHVRFGRNFVHHARHDALDNRTQAARARL